MTRLLNAARSFDPSPRATVRVSIAALFCAVCAIGASGYVVSELSDQQAATEKVAARANRTAAVNCWRTLTLGPYSVKDARDRALYPSALQLWAESAIPKKCPPIPASLMPPTGTTP